MKALIVSKEFNGHQVGTIIGYSESAPNNYMVNEGFIAVADLPEEINQKFAQVSYDLIAEYWSKSGEINVSIQPTINVNQPITQNDESWTHHPAFAGSPAHWTKEGFATQYDPPPMIIVNGQEVEDETWTYHPAETSHSEFWSKDGEEYVFSQPTILVDNFVDVPDESWTHHPAHYEWTFSENTVAKTEYENKLKTEKYLKRIQYADTLIANIGSRNEDKENLTESDIAQMNSVYGPIMQLLKSGSFVTARNIIVATSPSNGITSDDINYIVGLITLYLNQEAEIYG